MKSEKTLFDSLKLVRHIHQQNETSKHKKEISKWFTKVYWGPVLSCGYFGSVERITGGTKHTGSDLKTCQKNNILASKSFPLKNILVSA